MPFTGLGSITFFVGCSFTLGSCATADARIEVDSVTFSSTLASVVGAASGGEISFGVGEAFSFAILASSSSILMRSLSRRAASSLASSSFLRFNAAAAFSRITFFMSAVWVAASG